MAEAMSAEELEALGKTLAEMGLKPKADNPQAFKEWMEQYVESVHSLPKWETKSAASSYIPPVKISYFSGDSSAKGHVDFDVWLYEVECLMKSESVSPDAINQVVRHSLKGDAARVAMRLGPATKAINGSSAVTKKTAIQKTTKAEPKGSIASMMFSGSKKTSTDSSTKTAATQNEKSDTVTKSKKTKEPKGSIVSMFASAPKKTGGKPSPTVQTSPTPDVRTDTRQEAVKEKGKPLKIGRTKKKGSPCSDDELKPDSKRRKRIKEDLFDSSSEEEMDILEDSPVPSPIREPSLEPEREPSVEPESPTPETKEDRLQEDATEEKSSTGGTRRRRTRKLVPKTYMDESGFMVTEKVWESDSTDASEVEEITLKQTQKKETTKQPEPEPLKKQAKGRKSPQKKGPASGKTQASLTSFFKKN